MAKNVLNQAQIQGTTLGYAESTVDFTTASTTPVQITGLSVTVVVPTGGRKVTITAYCNQPYATGTMPSFALLSLWDGVVGSGTELRESINTMAVASSNYPLAPIIHNYAATPGSHTYNLGMKASSGATVHTAASAVTSVYVHVRID